MINGEVRLSLEKDGLTLTAAFDAIHIPYADISGFEQKNYTVNVFMEEGSFTVTHLGSLCDAFYNELYAAYNAKVRKALFITGKPLFVTQGEYQYEESGVTARGTAPIEVYDNCVLLLPPDCGARRIPLCFLSAVNKSDFELTLKLCTGERYSFIRLGHDTAPFADCIARCLHALRENAVMAVRELDGTLEIAQARAVAMLMPEGVAVPMSRLYEIAPSLIEALEKRIAESRAADEYRAFQEICGPMRICVGMKSNLAGEDADNILWMIAPGQRYGTAAVELATSEETAAATFLYQGFEGFETFWQKLNQAMEAIAFKREAIRLTADELKKTEYMDYAMAVSRNAALRFIRAHFAGRAIHASPESWKREILAHLKG